MSCSICGLNWHNCGCEGKEPIWPSPPAANLFEDTSISVTYLKQIAEAMRNEGIDGSSYVEDIADNLDSLSEDYIRVIKQRDRAINFIKNKYNLDHKSMLDIINGIEKDDNST